MGADDNYRHGLEWFLGRDDVDAGGSIPHLPTNSWGEEQMAEPIDSESIEEGSNPSTPASLCGSVMLFSSR